LTADSSSAIKVIQLAMMDGADVFDQTVAIVEL